MIFSQAICTIDSSIRYRVGSLANNKKGLVAHILPLVLLLTLCLLSQAYSITNESMPAGDAGRVMPYIEFVDNSGVSLPLWNPYKFAGTPVLANPERFNLLSVFVASDGEFSYLIFNLVLILFVFLIGAAVYFLAQQFDISRAGSLVASSLMMVSQFTYNMVKSGRIDALTSTFLIIAAFLAYCLFLRQRKPYLFAFLCLIFALDINLHVYYATVSLYPFLLFLGFWHYSGGVLAKVFRSVLDLIMFSVVGVLCGMVFLLPLVEYTFSLYTSVESSSKLMDSQPIPGSLLNIFVPLFVQHHRGLGFVFSHVSLLLLPLLIIYVLTRKISAWKYEKLFLALLAYGLIFNLGRLLPFSFLVEFMSNVTVLKQIRWANAFWLSALLAIIMFAGAAIDRIAHLDRQDDVGRKSLILTVSVFVVSIIMDIVYSLPVSGGLQDSERYFVFKRVIDQPELVLFVVALFFIPRILGSVKYRFYIFLAFLVVSVLLARPYSDMHRLENQEVPIAYQKILKNDDDYFRVYMKKGKVGLPCISNLNGHSLYFSDEHRAMLGLLFRKEIDELRPYYVDVPPLYKWNESSLDLLNIKYVEVKSRDVDDRVLSKWKIVANDSDTYLLQRRNWKQAIRVYPEWKGAAGKKIAEHMFSGQFVSSDELLIEGGGSHNTFKEADDRIFLASANVIMQSANELHIDVSSNTDGMLYVPEYYDKYWTAEVNGKPAPVYRAYNSFRAVPVGEGNSIVRMRYRPRSFYYGLRISIIAVTVVLLGLLAVTYVQRKKSVR